MPTKKRRKNKWLSKLKILGPGLITGASDDDPSGIATYSQVGAQFGLSTLWMAWLTFPLMATMQKMCARIGMVTNEGLTKNLKNHYPSRILWFILLLSFPATILNIGADIEGMGAAAHLILPRVPVFAFSIIFTALILFSIVRWNYNKIASVLKWFCCSLLVYLIVPFLSHVNWSDVAVSTLVPHITFSKDYINMMVAILGTTISPYLFFWQATMEVEGQKKKRKNVVIVDKRMLEEMKEDVDFGMLFSNIVMFFIILTCGTVLFPHNIRHIDTVEQAASALRPIAGNFAYALFAIGIIGTGFLAIPVLCGSISYMLAETFNLKTGLDKKFYQAKPFYIIIAISLLLGLVLNFAGITPMQALIYSAILYGITSPIIIVVVMNIGNNKNIMGANTNTRRDNILGWITFGMMTAAALALLYFQWS